MLSISKKIADPRLKVVCYLAWYAVLWIDSYLLLGVLLSVQALLFIILGGYRTIYIRILGALVIVGLLFSFVALILTSQQFEDLASIWFRWGVVVIATFNLAISISMREMFFALRFYHVPWSIIFTLGIAIRFLPISIDETRRCILAFKSRGIGFGKGYKVIWQAPKLSMQLLMPVLINVLNRGQRVWFSIELRGIAHRLFLQSAGEYSIIANIGVISLTIIPIVSCLYTFATLRLS